MIKPSQQSLMPNDQCLKKISTQFSNQSTTITINNNISQLPQSSKLQPTINSSKSITKQSSKISQSSPIQTIKSAMKALQLNPSQQQLVINQITQFIQQNKQRTVRSPSVNKKMPPLISPSKIPPLNNRSKQKRPLISNSKEKINQVTKSQSFINSRIVQPKNYEKINKDDHAKFVTQSTIIKSQQEFFNLRQFFHHIPSLKSFCLVFKASQHQFSLKSFFNQYGRMQNLLIICKTNKDKIIGGYSPLFHQFTGKLVFDDKFGQKVKDPTKSSFIFSLTNKEKLEVKKQALAVYRFRDKKYLIFGDWQFSICDSSNVNNKCRTDNFNMNYVNQKYKNNKESWAKFNGNEDQYFTTKQWEAWRVELLN